LALVAVATAWAAGAIAMAAQASDGADYDATRSSLKYLPTIEVTPTPTPTPTPAPAPALPWGDRRPVSPVETAYSKPETDYSAVGRIQAKAAFSQVTYDVRCIPVDAKAGDLLVHGSFFAPSGSKSPAALIAIHGLLGLDQATLDEANAVAQLGVPVLAIDLFEGKRMAARGEIIQAFSRLDRDRTLKLLAEAAQWLAAKGGATPYRVGYVGYGLGADWALRAAGRAGDQCPGAIAFDGGASVTDEELAAIKAPLLAFFSRRDPWLAIERIDAFEAMTRKAGIKERFFKYDVDSDFQLHPQDDQARSYAQTARSRMVDLLLGR
jgi:dienelactone hydrolase